MSVIVDGANITDYVAQGGIQESAQRVYASDSSAEDAAQSKGAHYVYSISARFPTDIKDALADCVAKTAVSCTVDSGSCKAEMTNFTASLVIENGNLTLWDASFTLTDIALSSEDKETS